MFHSPVSILLFAYRKQAMPRACVVCNACILCSSIRAIIVRNGEIIPMSTEFTPESERQRLQFLVRGESC